jgi:hypothetical protein
MVTKNETKINYIQDDHTGDMVYYRREEGYCQLSYQANFDHSCFVTPDMLKYLVELYNKPTTKKSAAKKQKKTKAK